MGQSPIYGSNQELNDKLTKDNHITSPTVERVLRSVDRGLFLDNITGKFSPYHDGPWKVGNIHLSAPCIYAKVLDALDLKPGLSFLNLGSGTGYLSTLVGLMIGPHGVNHGIEIHDNVVAYANKKLAIFKQRSFAMDKHDFLEPTFIQGDCLRLNPSVRRYDRIYLGAACQPEQEDYMKDLLKIGGILVMPLNEQLVRYERINELTWDKQILLSVVFNTLIDREANKKFELPEINPKSLTEICRDRIRQFIRDQIDKKYPDLKFCDNLKQRKNMIKRKMREKSRSNKVSDGPNTRSKSSKTKISDEKDRKGSSKYNQVSEIANQELSSSSSSSTASSPEPNSMVLSLPFMMQLIHNRSESDTGSKYDDEDIDSSEEEFESSNSKRKGKRKSISKSKHDYDNSKVESQTDEPELRVKRQRVSESSQYFAHLRKIIIDLPLPQALKLYVNYDRKLLE